MQVDLALVPPAASPGARTCIVIDVLRATSVMAVLLGRGVDAVFPAPSIAAGRALRDRLAASGPAPMLCGEIDARPPEGYDFGNSPGEFAALPVLPADRAVVATTNGTPALLACADAPLAIAAAPLNAAAAVAVAEEAGHDVLVVCSGLRGAPADDDRLAAGLLIDGLVAAGASPTPAAAAARADYDRERADLAAAFRATEHGRRLLELGFGDDIALCARRDRFAVVGELRDGPDGPHLVRRRARPRPPG